MHWTDTHNSRSAPTSFSLAEISAEDLRIYTGTYCFVGMKSSCLVSISCVLLFQFFACFVLSSNV